MSSSHGSLGLLFAAWQAKAPSAPTDCQGIGSGVTDAERLFMSALPDMDKCHVLLETSRAAFGELHALDDRVEITD